MTTYRQLLILWALLEDTRHLVLPPSTLAALLRLRAAVAPYIEAYRAAAAADNAAALLDTISDMPAAPVAALPLLTPQMFESLADHTGAYVDTAAFDSEGRVPARDWLALAAAYLSAR